MTEQEQLAIKAATKIAVCNAFDDGLMTAAEMIRLAVQQRPGISSLEIASAIEATATPTQLRTPHNSND